MNFSQSACPIVKKTEIAPGIFDYLLSCPEIASAAQPGQFAHISAPGFSLRRPISICEIFPADGLIRIVFEVRGAGTAVLAQLAENDRMDLLAPLGNGFPEAPTEEKIILVGGGIGVPPLLGVASRYGKNASVIIGFRTAGAVILAGDFARYGCDVTITTDDGSLGYHGLVTGPLEKRLESPADKVFACGPTPMLRGVVSLAQRHNVPSFVSLEERMGCGVGACLVCACRTVRDGREIFTHVCKDGPVFSGETVVFDGGQGE